MLPSHNSDISSAKIQGLERQLQGLSNLIQVEQKVRLAANTQELGFLMVNETNSLVAYHQAVLWLPSQGRRRAIAALSGISEIDTKTPYVTWLKKLVKLLKTRKPISDPIHFTVDSLPGSLNKEWTNWFPNNALWLPLLTKDGKRIGAIILARDKKWSDSELNVLTHIANTYSYSLEHMLKKRGFFSRLIRAITFSRIFRLIMVAGLVALMWLPVKQSVLASAEVVASNPTMVRAPLDGVIDRFHIQPNQQVEHNQLLVSLDDVMLKNRLIVAKKNLKVTNVKYRQAAQQAVFDRDSQAKLALLKGQMEQQAAETQYLKQMLDRVQIRAESSGIVIVDDLNDWLGRPVVVGEKILMIADKSQAEILIQLPANDAIALNKGAELLLFLGIDPQNPIPGRLYFASYSPNVTPEGFLAYRLKGEFNKEAGPPPRIGLKGTVKIYGEEVTLFYYLFRRPLAALRQTLGM
ncbi:MAG: HlyD family efflux transporter periplasmic adaptor subunit [Magnetococcales bacterium]|nr:HlyD family efflux transporter periplasmic adaptor subunit [Magnetococcales bacterium]